MRRIYTVVLFTLMASIDNTVLALLPALSPQIGSDFGVAADTLGLLIGGNLLIVAVTALFWGYRSDRGDRRRLLILGTLAWAIPVALVPLTASFGAFLALMLLAGLGLGCISTVGYSIISDLVTPRWRGLIMGVWGLAQGIGALFGAQLVSLSSDWRGPFGVLAATGVVCSALALLALSPRKGQSEDALRGLAERDEYDYRIQPGDLGLILNKPSNRWLIAQGFIAQFTFGSLTWLVFLLTARLEAQGVAPLLANQTAAQMLVVLQLGGIVSLFWGWAGDQLQRRRPRIRALLAAYGFWAAVPCYTLLFWAPLPISSAQTTGSAQGIVAQQLAQNGWWLLAVLAATLATIAQATNAPNWYALVSEVNLPEHRGTAFSFIAFANNVGRALGAALVGLTFTWLERTLPAPTNYALGLTLFQLFFIPAGLCFWLASRTAPRDAAAVQDTLQQRAAELTRASVEPMLPAPALAK